MKLRQDATLQQKQQGKLIMTQKMQHSNLMLANFKTISHRSNWITLL